MENTSVLTVGVTSDRALGSTFNTLRAQFERLRMPLEGMQVEPYISEISRLGLEVDKTAQAQRRLASDQTWALKAQVDQVRRLADEIERLRKLCLSASEIGSTQAPRQSVVMKPVQRPMSSDSPEPRSSEQGFIPLESANSGLTVVKAGMIGTATVGAGVAAAALGRAAHRMYKRQSLKGAVRSPVAFGRALARRAPSWSANWGWRRWRTVARTRPRRWVQPSAVRSETWARNYWVA